MTPSYAMTMNSLNAFSPLIRRSAQAQWTCHACLTRQAPRLRNGYATKTNASVKLPAGNAAKSNKRRRRLMVVGGGLTLAGAAVTLNDDAKHAYTAVQRSSRVLSTLFVNVKECVCPCSS